ncbi:DUF4125 family protein [Alloscardovia omnicolens]|jgi:hypothetical protein|uniref:DUF4125 family protein n=1 Tax=Alloscardovia omnicolens TaxID=419015 RepID=UPI002550B5D5|nr:DUF4125 family protein [Alloscardovia omnicolens]MDK6249529.1 DUF4125 family protein [Alloscardovia omnicolens]MDK6251701.1 DUF4125 family protein [Alloscardovia omnicolens]
MSEQISVPDLAESIVRTEWHQFQQVNNEGGRANCQGNWPTFHVMRLSQFLTWTVELLRSYERDLASGRNLLMEKYAWMMASTQSEYFHKELEPYLLQLSDERIEIQEKIIDQQLQWARDFHAQYPTLGDNMRVLTTNQDTDDATSFETYLRGELSTYSNETVLLYSQFIETLARENRNLTHEIITWTVKLSGYENLDAAQQYLTM